MMTGERADWINLDGKLYRLTSLRGTARRFGPEE